MEYQTTLPASWEICMLVKKQQLELDMEQQTGCKSETEYIMWNAGLHESPAGIKTARRNINNPRDAHDTTVKAESEEKLKSL